MRLRDLGITPGMLPPGALNAITDVPGVRVGHVTLIEGDDVRTGVTAIHPHEGSVFREKVSAGVCTINGYGKATGFEQVRERGVIETPIVLTNTLNVARAGDALVGWMLRENPDIGLTTGTCNPVVAECSDAFLNDIRGRHVHEEHVWQALDSAAGGAVAEGNVGAGVGTACFQFKGGIGTASRVVDGFTVGALVQSNYGTREEMMMLGVPVGLHLREEYLPEPGPGSIIMVVATDAPLDARQLGRVARRGAYALGRTGSTGHDGSGDFAIAFSTANRWPHVPERTVEPAERFTEIGRAINGIFLAAVEAIEEAIWNSMIAAETLTGRGGNTLYALPHADVIRLFDYYHRDNPRRTT